MTDTVVTPGSADELQGVKVPDGIVEADLHDSRVPEGFLAVKPFMPITAAERNAIYHVMDETSGLRHDQYVVNTWGFPVMPVPFPRTAHGRTRMAPQNVARRFLGHPIYWIDPTLTAIDPTRETWEQWSIRMFFLLVGFGAYDKDYHWVDRIATTTEVDARESEVDAYHVGANPPCTLDGIRVLTLDDLQVAYEELQDHTASAIARCREMLTSETTEFFEEQLRAYAEGRLAFGDDILNVSLTPDDAHGMWAIDLEPALTDISRRYNAAIRESPQNPQVAWVVQPLGKALERVRQAILHMDELIVTLSVPVLQQGASGSETFSDMIAYLKLAGDQAAARGSEYDLDRLVLPVVTTGRHDGAVDAVIDAAYGIYRNAWRRLRMVVVNYERMMNGQVPFTTWSEFEVDLSHQNSVAGHERMAASSDLVEGLDALFSRED